MTTELYPDGVPVTPVTWTRYKQAQRDSDHEPLPAEFSWLHPWAGSDELPPPSKMFAW